VLFYPISLKSLEKYNEKLPYELLVLFVHLLPEKLRLLYQTYKVWTQVSFDFDFDFILFFFIFHFEN